MNSLTYYTFLFVALQFSILNLALIVGWELDRSNGMREAVCDIFTSLLGFTASKSATLDSAVCCPRANCPNKITKKYF